MCRPMQMQITVDMLQTRVGGWLWDRNTIELDYRTSDRYLFIYFWTLFACFSL